MSKEMWAYLIALAVSLLAIGVAVWMARWVKKLKSENAKIAYVSSLIKSGANTFLKREYTILAVFAGILFVFILLFLPKPIWQVGDEVGVNRVLPNLAMALSYLIGTIFSGIAGKIGIDIATIANVKSAEAATKGIKPSFMAGFRGGAVMGMAVVASCLLGVTLVFWATYGWTGNARVLIGFSFGASSLALFAKAGGGIFTKTADISADLVGKVELSIPEDDPRNPAVIADNVGDNVGDVAGMGADLFDSNVASLAAALVLAIALDSKYIPLVFLFATAGLLSSIIGVATANIGKHGNPTRALNSSTYITTGIYFVLTAVVTVLFDFVLDAGTGHSYWFIWGSTVLGLLVGVVIGLATDYFTDDSRKPVHMVATASESGPAFTILSGISYGFLSVFPAMVGIGISALGSYLLTANISATMPATAGMFGISMAAVGMLSIVGMIISNDAYGPIVDNARGLVEMGNLGEEALEITDKLDSAGNTVKAVTKGFAIGAAGLTVIALLGAFMSEANALGAGLTGFDVMDPVIFFGLLVGAAVPAVFSALLMLGVNRNAQRMIKEIHRQFNDIPGLKDGQAGVEPEYDKCIDIATKGALKELVVAGLFAILVTIAVGFIGGVKAIGGFLVGNIVVGLLLALFMSNSGGLWDNTKKYVESGHHGGKGSFAHKAAVTGDTVGDPFKDTAGPSINTQITVVSLVSSLMAYIFILYSIF
ncbi:MAG TPA: sodium-translocating pyrophosphatase [Bacilli bacterium]|jgi:K(+)-stimulated pyrophosphate-energized sodium pump|nr:sodium-translocating pyrophosphatase [Bacilli bacterium]